ncbi:response regulator [Massilia sp. NEAU-DD11]|uniref:Response regulator n=1 Tax=Massilia cellulosiltytica TaxID=2683234 RepID=A0A7X3K6B8_9BURK|nr:MULTISPECIES: response regulator [Telluria group]MVW59719.1 response regulator [Telluria cellulosilytica]
MRRILILDDEPSVLSALRRTLRAAFPPDDVVIEAFDEPEAAVLRGGEQDFDVVISDYRMPGLNGADVLQLMKGLQPEAVRIVVSATKEILEVADAVNRAEVFRYLAKPWQQEELVATVREAFARRDRLAPPRPAPDAADGHDDALRRLERDEPGITRVDWDEDGNIRLF